MSRWYVPPKGKRIRNLRKCERKAPEKKQPPLEDGGKGEVTEKVDEEIIAHDGGDETIDESPKNFA
jgi:hypothetical protein